MHQIIMLYALNLYNVILHLNKAKRKIHLLKSLEFVWKAEGNNENF